MNIHLSPAILAFVFITFWMADSSVAASTDWQDIGGGEARMIAVLAPDTGKISGAIEIRLNPGWKTYWRAPGDSGIPPQLSFAGSKGYKHDAVHLPTPQQMKIQESQVVGYKSDVSFVFDGTMLSFDPENNIRLEMFLGVCEKICIPAQANFEIPMSKLNRSDPVSNGFINLARENLPGKPTAEVGIERVNFSRRNLQIFANIPSAEKPLSLFVEGPPEWRLAPASLVRINGRLAEFILDLSQVPPEADIAKKKLRYTLVSGNHSVEQWKKAE
ncbi:MAG: protein-disulfide reductase DsbD family protein [Rhizobiaceae bacterium]